jgi:hypothetical protein
MGYYSPKERVLNARAAQVLSFGKDYYIRASPFR